LFYFPFHMDATMVNLLWVKNVMLLQKHSTLITCRIAYLLGLLYRQLPGGYVIFLMTLVFPVKHMAVSSIID